MKIVNLSAEVAGEAIKSGLEMDPDILIATPARASALLKRSDVAKIMAVIVIDTDRAIAFGHRIDIRSFMEGVEKNNAACILLSQTSAEDVRALCRSDPSFIEISIERPNTIATQLVAHYIAQTPFEDRYLYLYVMLKLRVTRGRTIIYTSSIHNCYKIKIFLEAFSLRSAVIDDTQPLKTRVDTLSVFTKDFFGILILTNHNLIEAFTGISFEDYEQQQQGEGDEGNADNHQAMQTLRSEDYTMPSVSLVINVFTPESSKIYRKRIQALSNPEAILTAVTFHTTLNSRNQGDVDREEAVLKKMRKRIAPSPLRTFEFDKHQVEGFRYRVEDIVGKIRASDIQGARAASLRSQMLENPALTEYFSSHPQDLAALQAPNADSNKILRSTRTQLRHLRRIPDYLLPSSRRRDAAEISNDLVTFTKHKTDRVLKSEERRRRAKARISEMRFAEQIG